MCLSVCSGGIPIAFPQVGPGPLPTHGFLRHLHWSVVETFMVEGAEDPCPTGGSWLVMGQSVVETWEVFG